MPLVAYNINLNTPSLEIAHDIAKKIRFIGGGLRYCKAMGVELKDRGDYPGIHQHDRLYPHGALPCLRTGTHRSAPLRVSASWAVRLLGLVPMEALIDTASYYLGLENFSMQQVLEARIME